MVNKQATLCAKACVPPHKLMCIFWNKGVIYYKLLLRNVTITAEFYFQQLRYLGTEMHEKTSRNIASSFCQCYKSDYSRAWLGTCSISMSYSPDLSLSVFHRLNFLSNNICGISFNNNAAIKNCGLKTS